jgi:hypothetical protein
LVVTAEIADVGATVGTIDPAVADCIIVGVATGILKYFNQSNEPQMIATIITIIIVLGNLGITFG